MKRAIVILFVLFISAQCAVFSAPQKMLPASSQGKEQLPNIFIYTIPDTDFTEENDPKDAPLSDYIDTDNVTTEKPIELVTESDYDKNENIALGATVLKGYAQFVEDTDAIRLKDEHDNFILNIKNPQKIAAVKGMNLKSVTAQQRRFRSINDEYLIAPDSISASEKIGNFTIGAQYNNEIDRYAMLEKETGLFTKYEIGRFKFNTSIAKSLDTTSTKDSSTFSFEPEYRLNNYMSIKNKFSSNVTYNRYSSQLMLSINPFGKKDIDRLKFELGAKGTFNKETETTTSQFLFSTKFKL